MRGGAVSLRASLILLQAAAAFFIAAALAVTEFLHTREAVVAELRSAGELVTSALAEIASEDRDVMETRHMQPVVFRLAARSPHVKRLIVVGSDGRYIADSEHKQIGQPTTDTDVLTRLADTDGEGAQSSHTHGTDLEIYRKIYGTYDQARRSAVIAVIVIEIATDHVGETVLAEMLAGSWATFLLIAALAALSIILIRRRVVRPLADVVGAAERLGRGDLSARAAVHRADEIGTLALTFNRMADEIAAARRELEARAAELQRSNEDLDRYAYVTSHDLQEPLRMVEGYGQLLSRRLKEKLDQDSTEFLGYMTDGARRMRRMITDLLEYSRVATRGAEPGRFASGAALDEALENLEGAIRESGAIIERGELPAVIGDRRQIRQVLQNLVGNAIKYRSAEAPRLRISAAREGEFWRFELRDNGIGIDPKHQGRLFQVFSRLHSEREYPGSGIGLAICRRIVERAGGRIGFDSEPGQGATFWFTLPAAETKPGDRQAA